MASQMYGITGKRNMKRDQISELEARLGMLPSILATKQKAEQVKKEDAFRNKQFKEQKDQSRKAEAFSQLQAKRGMGLEVAKMGVNLGTSPYLRGDAGGGAIANQDGLVVSKGGPTGGYDPQMVKPKESGFFSGVDTNSAISGGLAGFGVGSMMSGKSKSKKLLFGAGAGMLTGLLSGGYSGMLGGAGAGLFGGLMS